MTRKPKPKAPDPLLRACTACGARIGEGCRYTADHKPLLPRATRLVHAARLEGATDGR